MALGSTVVDSWIALDRALQMINERLTRSTDIRQTFHSLKQESKPKCFWTCSSFAGMRCEADIARRVDAWSKDRAHSKVIKT